jgi:3'-phosphoadenosine 5'-phosphosulfate sulfotransferase (PAPS reductase)/FAD synthetase
MAAGRRSTPAQPTGQLALFTPARPKEPVPDLPWFDLIAVSLSGGKDSMEALRRTMEEADKAGVRDRVVCLFADLGEDEWPGTPEMAAQHAAWYGLRFITVCRQVTDPVTGQRRQQGLLEHIWHRGMWPNPRNRYCTSDLKRGPIRTAITALVRERTPAVRARHAQLRAAALLAVAAAAADQARLTPWLAAAARYAAMARPRRVRVLSVMGMRAQESADRRLMAPYGPDLDASNETVREVHLWLPVHARLAEEIWAGIAASGVPYHYAYDLGMPRLSCVQCVLASKKALITAARARPEHAGRRVLVEAEFVRRRAVATIAIAVRYSALPPFTQPGTRLWLLAGLKRVHRSGPWFRKDLSMAQVVREAAAAGPLPPLQRGRALELTAAGHAPGSEGGWCG